jgi:hypothetical protein
VGGGGGAREMQSKSQQRAVVTAGRDARTGGVGSTRRGRVVSAVGSAASGGSEDLGCVAFSLTTASHLKRRIGEKWSEATMKFTDQDFTFPFLVDYICF